MLRVGMVGVGFMGMVHYRAYEKLRGVKVAAISTRDPKKLAGDWRGIKGNFGPPGELVDLEGVSGYREWRELLNDPRIDLVDICLPPALHAEVAIAALDAGKHVLVEKPLALTTADARRMVETARRVNKQLLVAHVLPFIPEYAWARKAITSGKYGRLIGGTFRRIISEPTWIPDFFDPDTVGGPVVDLHIHDAHFIRLVCGMPRGLFTTGRMRGDVAELFTTQFVYDDLAVSASSGVIRQAARSFTHAFEIYLEKATLLFDSAVIEDRPVVNMPLTVLLNGGKVVRPEVSPTDAFEAELGEAARSIRNGRTSDVLAPELALDALSLCHKQTQSIRRGRPVKI
jgi:predicted dehydrogenase